VRREVLLPVDRHAATRAREALDAVVPPPELGQRADDARLAVSEVVTNAVLHGGLGPDDTIRIVFETDATALRVEVEQRTDAPAAAISAPPSPGPEAVGGFGLMLGSRVVDDWGVERGPPGRVWFELRR
jgi:anti-sigma regulatory factor (Ser/Thr protein kinase)